MANALWITLVGMSLVFLAILLLWGLMALLVRLTSAPVEKPAQGGLETASASHGSTGDELEHKRRAAAAAAAVALALQQPAGTQPAGVGPGESFRPAAAQNAWQIFNRARQAGRRKDMR